MLGDVVHPEHARAAHQRDHVRRQRADEALVRPPPDDPADERLPRETDEDRRAEPAEPIEIPDAGDILPGRLAEADAGVEQNAAERHAGPRGEPQRPLEEPVDVVENVEGGVGRLAVVHDDDARAGLGDHTGHAGVALQAPDVVDDAGAEPRRLAGHLGLARVHGDGRVEFGCERRDHRGDPPQLLPGVDRRMTGPRRLAADVDDRRALRRQGFRVGDRGGRVGVQAAVRERIGRDVDDAHQRRRPAEAGEKAVAQGGAAGVGHGGSRIRPPAPRGCAPRTARLYGTIRVRISRSGSAWRRPRARSRPAGCPCSVRA